MALKLVALVIISGLAIEFCGAVQDAGPSEQAEPSYMDFDFLQDFALPPELESSFQHDLQELAHEQSPSIETPTSVSKLSTSSGLQRWEQLHTELFDDAIIDSTAARVEQILSEMSNLEIGDDLKAALQDLMENQDADSRLKRYKILEQTCQLHGIIAQPEQSLTESLLETYDQNSMDCSEPNIIRLRQLKDTFQAEYTLYVSLTQNLDAQLQNCWSRHLTALQAIKSLMSAKDLHNLDSIKEKIAFPPVTRPYVVTAANGFQMVESQAAQYVPAIALLLNERFLVYMNSRRIDVATSDHKALLNKLNEDYKRYIEVPCKRLSDLAGNVQDSLLSLVKLIGHQKLYMSKEQESTINRLKMCHFIMNVKDMRKRVLLMLGTSLPDQQPTPAAQSGSNSRSKYAHSSPLEPNRTQRTPPKQVRARDTIMPQLITMQMPLETLYPAQMAHPNPSLVPTSTASSSESARPSLVNIGTPAEAARRRDLRRNIISSKRNTPEPSSQIDLANIPAESMQQQQQQLDQQPAQAQIYQAPPTFEKRQLPAKTSPGAKSLLELRQKVEEQIPLKNKTPLELWEAKMNKRRKESPEK